MQRIEWVNVLRGPAALAVVFSHLAEGQGVCPDLLRLLGGQVGVCLFFLVSGFVTPLALEKYSAGGFLLGRVVRLWPTWCLGVLLVIWLGDAKLSSGRPLWPSVLPGVCDLLGARPVNAVMWTLETEVRWYLLAACCAGLLRGRDLGRLGWFALVVVVGGLVCGAGVGIVREVAKDCEAFVLMLAGVVLSWVHAGKVGRPAGVACVLVLVLSSCVISLEVWQVAAAIMVPAKLLGLLAFVCGSQIRLPRVHQGHVLADVSYSLYVSHMACVPAVAWFVGQGLSTWTALTLAAGGAFSLALMVFLMVEEPTREAAGRLARSWSLSPRMGSNGKARNGLDRHRSTGKREKLLAGAVAHGRMATGTQGRLLDQSADRR